MRRTPDRPDAPTDHATLPDPAGSPEPDVATPPAANGHAEAGGDWESLWIDLGGEG